MVKNKTGRLYVQKMATKYTAGRVQIRNFLYTWPVV